MVKPSFETYKEIGTDFKKVCPYAEETYTKLTNIFGLTNLRELDQVIKIMEKTRSQLDDSLCRDYADRSVEELRACFYGIPGEPKLRYKKTELPDKKHNRLTFEEYQIVGKEIKDLEKAIRKLSIKSQKIHGKTKVRIFLDSLHKFNAMGERLEDLMGKDLGNKKLETIPGREILSVFF